MINHGRPWSTMAVRSKKEKLQHKRCPERFESRSSGMLFCCATEMFDGCSRRLRLYRDMNMHLTALAKNGIASSDALVLSKRLSMPVSVSRLQTTELVAGRILFQWLERGESRVRSLEIPLPPDISCVISLTILRTGSLSRDLSFEISLSLETSLS